MLQSRGPIISHVAPGEWSLHGLEGMEAKGGGGRAEWLEGGGCIIFFPFLSSSRQQALAK